MYSRIIRNSAFAALAVGAAFALFGVYTFSQARFFSIDEWQFGHATWLVSRGATPYLDFFEHHFPLSYLVHAPFFWFETDFSTQALLLRKIVFGTILLAALISAWCCWRVTGNAFAALLTFFVPPTFGFSLMSAIDYRADTFSSFYFIACLALLERNRKQGSRGLAVVCGLLAFVAAGMTQKMSFIAGLSLGAMLMTDLVMRLPWLRNLRGVGPPFLARPLYFVLAGALPTAILITAGGALGVLELAFDSTILQAIEHEQTYVRFSLFEKGYVTPFLARTALTTLPILAFALVFLPTRAGRFWIFPIGVSILGGSLMVAPYPYNFVFLCWAGVLASVRGFALAVSWLGARFSFLKEAHPLFYLLPLIVYSNQMSFVTGATSNEHQLETLERLERYGEPTDAIIDNAGGGLFSPDG